MDPWFERRFTFDFPATRYVTILERLAGTPARLEERVGEIPSDALTRRDGDRWSIQEHAGHLLDLEPLWARRLDDFLDRRPGLSPADLSNRRTHEADHNAAPIDAILAAFRRARTGFVDRLRALDAADFSRVARHPRLDRPMRLVDSLYFVAEHDDHHLARITELERLFASTP